MRNVLVLLTLMFVYETGCADPIKSEKQKIYYSTTVGSKWVMTNPVGSAANVEVEYEITTSIKTEKGTVVTVKTENFKEFSKLLISDDEITEIEFKGSKLDPSNVLIKRGKIGLEWSVDTIRGNERFQAKCLRGESKEIIVPAGKFLAIPIVLERTNDLGRKYKSTKWYAQDVGVIQISLEGEKEPLLVMKSFTPGKK